MHRPERGNAAVNAKPSSEAPRYVAGLLVAFVGVSAANAMPGAAQLLLFLIGLAAALERPHWLPKREGLVILVAVTYLFLCRLAMGGGFDGTLRMIRPFLEGLTLASVLFYWCRIRSFRSAAIVLAGFVAIQFAIAVAMLVHPVARIEFLEQLYSDEGYQNVQFAAALLFRGYGYSRHHLYGLPLACGLAAALILVSTSIDSNRRILLGSLASVGILLVAVNGRIGFVPVITVYIAGTFLLRDLTLAKHLLAVVALLLIPLAYFAAANFGDNFEVVWTWLAAGLEQFGTGDQPDSTTLSELQRMLVVSPNVVELIVGIGGVCTGDADCNSDIGFVRALQEGGMVYLALVLYLYWRVNQHAVQLFEQTSGLGDRHRHRAALLVALVLQTTFVAAMAKGEAFGSSDYSRLVVALGFLGIFAAARARSRRTSVPWRNVDTGPMAGATPPSPST